MASSGSFAIYCRNPETRSMERIPGLSLRRGTEGGYYVTLHRKFKKETVFQADQWYTISQLVELGS